VKTLRGCGGVCKSKRYFFIGGEILELYNG